MKNLKKIKRLYDSVGPNPQVVRWAFMEKNLDVDTRVLGLTKDKVPENRSSEMMEKNPAGTTPFVELENGTIIAETYAICQYLDRLAPVRPFLTGDVSDPVKHAETTMWIERTKLQIVLPYMRQFQYGEGLPYFKNYVSWAEASEPSVTGLRQQVKDNLCWLEENMNKKDSMYIAGGEICYADMHLYSTLTFMSNPKVNSAKRTEFFDPLSELVMNEKQFPWLLSLV